METVSVIVPLYKGERYIQGIIEMISRNLDVIQGRLPDCTTELILVNDYPPEPVNLCTDELNYGVTVINNEENLGIHGSRVRGINAAKGQYVYMLDQDDTIDDTFLYSQMMLLIHNREAVMAVSHGVTEHTARTRQIYNSRLMHLTVKHISCYAYMDNRIVSPGQCVIKKSAIPEFWKEHCQKQNGADDLMLWLLILSVNQPRQIIINENVGYRHVNTNENASLDLEKMHQSVDETVQLLRKSSMVSEKILNIIDYRNHCAMGITYNGKIKTVPRFTAKALNSISEKLYRERQSQ